MGVNGHTVQFRPELYQPVATLVRDYHPVEWDLGKDTDFATQFPLARNGVDWSSVYGSWNKAGWRIDVSLMFESIPRDKWKDVAADARNYGERFARAFGPSSKLALIESVEIGNEPGKWSDTDYRVMFENMARGLRAGDPKLKIATCALVAGKSHAYAKSVECIAGLEDLYDVLNVHSYPELKGWPTWQRSFPEDPKLKKFIGDITDLCKWRDSHARGKQVWLTEFGYDSTTKKPDPKTEFKEWIGVTDEQQAVWLVRSWLLLATMPIDRAYMYFFNDSDQPQVHGSSGLTRNFQPKPSFWAAAHLQKTLGNYRFARKLASGGANVEEFVGADQTNRIWVIWLPTGEAHTEKISLPPLPGKIARAERLALRPNDDNLVPVNGAELEVSERPIFLFFQ
jgi:serine/threonine-protein kinase ATR